MGLLHGIDNAVNVEGSESTEVDDLGMEEVFLAYLSVNSLLLEFGGSLKRDANSLAEGDDGDIASYSIG